jgi:DNA-binding NtrC family response regulator
MGDVISLLHVENDPAFANLVETYLGRTDTSFDFHHASDVDEALSTLDERSIDCVVSDRNLPERDGLVLLAAVRRRDDALPFVLLTGEGSEDVAARAIRAGASDYIQKFGGTERYEVLARRVESPVETYEAKRRLRRTSAAIENASDGIALFDAAGTFVYLNEASADLYGYDPSELRGDSWERLYPEEEVARYEEHV